MSPGVGRRSVVGAALAALAGCNAGAGDADRRTLTPTLTKARRHPEGWLLSTIVEATARPGGTTFRDVTLLGYAEGGRRVCRKPLGDVEVRGRVQTVRVTTVCSAFPRAVALDAAASPCDPGTALRVAVADRTPAGTTPAEERDPVEWTTRDRRCGEGLPPAVGPATPPA